MSKHHPPPKTWASCGKNVHADLISALARLYKKATVGSVYLPVLCLCPFAGSLNLARPHSSVEFQLCTALQERVNADQHFDSKSDHEKKVKHFLFVI